MSFSPMARLQNFFALDRIEIKFFFDFAGKILFYQFHLLFVVITLIIFFLYNLPF